VCSGANAYPDATLTNLQAVFAKGDVSGCNTVPRGPCKHGVFEVSQDPIIIPQDAYGTAYNNPNFPKTSAQFILDLSVTQKTFKPIDQTASLRLRRSRSRWR